MHRSDTAELVQLTLGDFRIQHSELQFGGTLVDTETGGIHTGRWRLYIIYLDMVQYPHRWHGEVVIHSYKPRDDAEVGVSTVSSVQTPPLQVRAWLATVRCLAHIRHESVLLYMGAAVDPPRFAIVTSPVKVGQLSGEAVITLVLTPHTARHNPWPLHSATAPDPAPAPRWPIITSYVCFIRTMPI